MPQHVALQEYFGIAIRSVVYVTLFAITLTACVPASGAYYRLSSPEGIPQGYCSDVGPPVILKLKRDNVVIVIHDIRVDHLPSGSSYAFTLDAYLHSKVDIVRFAWNELVATDEVTDKQLPLMLHGVIGFDLPYGSHENLNPDVLLSGEKYNDYSIGFLFTHGVSRKMRIHFPDMWVNDVRYPGFDINYALDSGIFLRC